MLCGQAGDGARPVCRLTRKLLLDLNSLCACSSSLAPTCTLPKPNDNSGLSMTTFRLPYARRLAKLSFQRRLVRLIFDKLIDSKSIEFVNEATDLTNLRINDTIMLKLPNLYYTVRILLKPDIMVGQTYVDRHWQVQPEKLYDFLYSIRSQEASKLQKWFLISNRAHLLRDAWKQRLFPIRSTRAVVEHYNTNAAFMSLILGPSLSYTCAFFDQGNDFLDEAQAQL
jgi:hypothetical protein